MAPSPRKSMKGTSRFSYPTFSEELERSRRLFVMTDSAPDTSESETEPEFPEPESYQAPFFGPGQWVQFLLSSLDRSSDGPASVSNSGFLIGEPATSKIYPRSRKGFWSDNNLEKRRREQRWSEKNFLLSTVTWLNQYTLLST